MKCGKRNRRFERVLCLLLALLLPSGLLPAASAKAADEDTLSIGTVQELLDFSKSCSLDTWSQGKTVVLTADLSLEGVDFSPIPTFGGVFDGNGHTIRGLSLQDGDYPSGLFGILQAGGEIRNLHAAGQVSPSGDADTMGGLVGISYGQIVNCTFQGIVIGSTTVGGLVGLNQSGGRIVNCSFRGSVTGEHYVGGIAGENFGSMVQCVNHGTINTTEIEPEPGMIEGPEGLDQLRSTENVPAGTDIGGIAGFSAGLIESCRNNGDVGYAHTGYNVGGIAGRQTGLLTGCVNSGTVEGRKDVGGIAGQMEPQVTLKYSEEVLSDLWDELDALEALMDDALGEAQEASSQVSDGMNRLTESVGEAKDVTFELTDAMTEWGNGSIETVNDAFSRLSGAIEEMEPAVEGLAGAMGETQAAADTLADALDKIIAADGAAGAALSELRRALTELREAAGKIREAAALADAALQQWKQGVGEGEKGKAAAKEFWEALGSLAEGFSGLTASADEVWAAWQQADWMAALGEDGLPGWEEMRQGFLDAREAWQAGAEALAEMVRRFPTLDGEELQQTLTELGAAAQDLRKAADLLGQALNHMGEGAARLEEAVLQGKVPSEWREVVELLAESSRGFGDAFSTLRRSARTAQDLVQRLADQPALSLESIGSDLSEKGNALDLALGSVLEEVRQVNETMTASSGTLLEQMRAINAQVGVVTDVLRRSAQDAQAGAQSDRFEDISEQELLANRDAGRITDARNKGIVEGDVNVGGIVGSMAIEYDFDPEDDLTEDGERSFDFRYQAAAVVMNSVHEGRVTAKKNYAGGIVGRADLGILYLCQGVGPVESTDGDYVGGIAGLLRTTIRSCWAKCLLSGGNYVGGVVGRGEEDSVTRDCCTLVCITEHGQYAGAVSGTEEGTFVGNLFVSEELAGLGRVSYSGKAEPVSFADFSALEDVPEALKTFTLTFRTDNEILKQVSFSYGDSFDEEAYPALPQREGYYARWSLESLEDLRFDTVVEAIYTPYITVLCAAPQRENGRAVFYIEGDYQEKDRLEAEPFGAQDALPEDMEPPAFRRQALTERWKLSIPDNGEQTHTLRYLPPEESGRLRLYLHTEAGWSQVQAREIGRYLVFPVTGNDIELAVCTVYLAPWVWALAAALSVFLLAMAVPRLRRRCKKESRERMAPPSC